MVCPTACGCNQATSSFKNLKVVLNPISTVARKRAIAEDGTHFRLCSCVCEALKRGRLPVVLAIGNLIAAGGYVERSG